MNKQYFQGDVAIIQINDKPDTTQEIQARDGMLILAEGEVSGHHHAIRYGLSEVARFRDDALARDMAPAIVGTAKLYSDDNLTKKLVRSGLLTERGLCIGYLVIQGGPMTVTHEEHDPITLMPSTYYIGRQREWTAGETRQVQD